MPNTTGLRGSLFKKPTITSSPTSGRKKVPLLLPASNVAIRLHTPSSFASIIGRRTRIRSWLLGSFSKAVTTPICKPCMAGSISAAGGDCTPGCWVNCSFDKPNCTSVFHLPFAISCRTPDTNTLPLNLSPTPPILIRSPGFILPYPLKRTRPRERDKRAFCNLAFAKLCNSSSFMSSPENKSYSAMLNTLPISLLEILPFSSKPGSSASTDVIAWLE